MPEEKDNQDSLTPHLTHNTLICFVMVMKENPPLL